MKNGKIISRMRKMMVLLDGINQIGCRKKIDNEGSIAVKSVMVGYVKIYRVMSTSDVHILLNGLGVSELDIHLMLCEEYIIMSNK